VPNRSGICMSAVARDAWQSARCDAADGVFSDSAFPHTQHGIASARERLEAARAFGDKMTLRDDDTCAPRAVMSPCNDAWCARICRLCKSTASPMAAATVAPRPHCDVGQAHASHWHRV